MLPRTQLAAAAITFLALGGGLLPYASAADTMPIDSPPASSSRDDHINRVVAISVDGLNPDAIRKLGPTATPALHRLMAQGTSTLNARSSVESTSTLPNHTSMLTSRKVAAAAHGHGVTFNDDAGQDRTVHKAAGRYIPSVFDVVHDRGMRTALFTSKDKFALFDRTWDARRGAPDVVGADNGRDKINAFVYRENEETLTSLVRTNLLRSPAAFTFVHFSQTDKIGHEKGYMSGSYLAAVRAVDARVATIVKTIADNPELRAHTAVILTSDHGGLGTSHSDATKRVNYTIPFMVWGKGIAKSDLYAINPTYRSPGTSRVGYAGAQPVRNGAVGNLALDLLDLPVIRGSHVAADRTLNVFR